MLTHLNTHAHIPIDGFLFTFPDTHIRIRWIIHIPFCGYYPSSFQSPHTTHEPICGYTLHIYIPLEHTIPILISWYNLYTTYLFVDTLYICTYLLSILSTYWLVGIIYISTYLFVDTLIRRPALVVFENSHSHFVIFAQTVVAVIS